jgi:ankyrin repeat protein
MAIDRPGAVWTRHKPTIPVSRSLWAAAKANDVVQLALLLDEGCPIDERDHRGYSPLMLAGYTGNVEAVELLLCRGADPNTADLFGNTVLMGAAYKGFARVVQRLLLAGADIDATNYGGLDARGFALTYERAEVLAILEQHAERAAVRRASAPPSRPMN